MYKRQAIQRLLAMGWTISDAALFLGVSRQHLYMVLTGRRVSKRLTAKDVYKRQVIREDMKGSG